MPVKVDSSLNSVSPFKILIYVIRSQKKRIYDFVQNKIAIIAFSMYMEDENTVPTYANIRVYFAHQYKDRF